MIRACHSRASTEGSTLNRPPPGSTWALCERGLVALLDDVAALARIEAASVDDVSSGAAKAGSRPPAW